jgi:hypothetical protein
LKAKGFASVGEPSDAARAAKPSKHGARHPFRLKLMNVKDIARAVRLLLLAAWVGAAIFFSAIVAPALFAVLPTRELAGAVVGRVLPMLNWAGLIIALALLASRRLDQTTTTARRIIAAGVSALAAATACGLLISARIEALRRTMPGPIDSLAPGDPLRQAFGQWHALSVLALAVGIVAATLASLAMAKRRADPLGGLDR